MAKIYKGDVGTIFRVNIGTDVTGMVWGRLYVRKPESEGIVVWDAVVDPEDSNKIRYVVLAGDLNEIGLYRVWSRVKKDGWGPLWGDDDEFNVHKAPA